MVVSGVRQSYLRSITAGAAVVIAFVLVLVLNRGAISREASQLKTAAIDQVCHRDSSQPVRYNGKTMWTLEEKPQFKPVIGLLFVGRRRYMEILECYVRRNLVVNGGWLEQVIWVLKTDVDEDIQFVKDIVDQVPEYSERTVVGPGYQFMYQELDPNAIYVKIDDDVVFFEDHTIPTIVTRMNENPRYLMVSANVMNQPALSFVHYHLDAIHPYLPENHEQSLFDTDERLPEPTDWRLSSNPYWYPEDAQRSKEDRDDTIRYWEDGHGKDPRAGHRWLRLPKPIDILQTPAARMRPGQQYSAHSLALDDWKYAAQQHYSFFENLEKDELWRYKFNLWHYYYDRLSINFIAFHGQTLVDHPPPSWDDEGYLTEILSKEIRKPVVLDGAGMAVHFGFNLQTNTLNTTDLLARYKLYAKEKICGRRWGE